LSTQVVVAGGAGLIGRASVEALARQGARVLALDRRAAAGVRVAELGDAQVWRRELQAFGRADAILLLAGVVGVTRVMADPEARARRERRAGRGADRRARSRSDRSAPARLLRVVQRGLPARAPAAARGRSRARVRPKAGVGHTPREGRGRAASRHRALVAGRREPVLLRFFNVVGPGQESGQGMVLPNFVERARAGLPIRVHGDGAQVRTLAHVDEVARVLVELIEHPRLPAGRSTWAEWRAPACWSWRSSSRRCLRRWLRRRLRRWLVAGAIARADRARRSARGRARRIRGRRLARAGPVAPARARDRAAGARPGVDRARRVAAPPKCRARAWRGTGCASPAS
jgi:hypothetical protein